MEAIGQPDILMDSGMLVASEEENREQSFRFHASQGLDPGGGQAIMK
jgi:hypothetical protein